MDWSDKGGRGYLDRSGLLAMNRHREVAESGRTTGYDMSVSYFISLSAKDVVPSGLLSGDANIDWRTPDSARVEVPGRAGVQVLRELGRTNHFANLHFVQSLYGSTRHRFHRGGGNIALSDGSVAQVSNAEFRTAMQDSTNALKRTDHWLVIPQ